MELGALIAAAVLLLLAAAHSALGETGFIRPLLAADWELAEIPRWAADRLTRGAWHITSMAWVGLAAVALGAPPMLTVGLAGLATGAAMFVALREHGAWPLFLLAGAAALHADGVLGATPLRIAAGVAATVVAGAGLLHVYWAAGGRAGLASVVPGDADDRPRFRPGALLTLAVAGALLTLAGLIGTRMAGVDHPVVVIGLAVAIVVLAARAVGDGRQVGFSKSDRSTRFSRADDRIFTPLVTMLAFGTGAALLI